MLEFKALRLVLRDIEADASLGLIKGRADLLAFEQELVEALCKLDSGLVEHFLLLLDTDDMLGPILEEKLADVLRVTRCDEHHGKVKVLEAFLEQLAQLLRANQFAVPILVLKEQVLPCKLVILTHTAAVLWQAHGTSSLLSLLVSVA